MNTHATAASVAGFDVNAVLARLLDKLYELISALPMLILALAIIWLGWHAGRWLSRRQAFARVAARNGLMGDITHTTVRWAVTALSVLVALELMNATAIVGAMLGTAGVMGVALGFAFKDTLENYLAGILMSLRQPFAPNDDVVIDGNEGKVMALTSRATILMTPDGNHLRLPNALVFRSVMLNYTRNPSRRFEFDVGLGVQEDLLQAQNLGVARLLQIPGVLASPPPRAFIQSLGDSNVQLRYRAWVDQRSHDFWLVRSEGIRTVKLALDDAGMDMPEPICRVQLQAAATTADSAPPASDIDGLAAYGLDLPAGPASVAPPRPPRRHRPAQDTPLDTSAVDDLKEPMAADRMHQPSPNLLDPSAAKE